MFCRRWYNCGGVGILQRYKGTSDEVEHERNQSDGKAGRVEAQVPPEWPDGTEVAIQRLDNGSLPDEEGAVAPDEIARTLAAMDQVEPFDMTDDQAAALDAWERKIQEYGIANLDKGIEDLFR